MLKLVPNLFARRIPELFCPNSSLPLRTPNPAKPRHDLDSRASSHVDLPCSRPFQSSPSAAEPFFNLRHPTTRSVALQFPIHLGVGEDRGCCSCWFLNPGCAAGRRRRRGISPLEGLTSHPLTSPLSSPSMAGALLKLSNPLWALSPFYNVPLNRRPIDPPASDLHISGGIACSWI